MDNKKKIILIVSIDTECDKGPNWIIQQPIRFTSVTEGIPHKLSPLFQSYDIKPTYLLSPEVIQNQECINVLRSLKGCELGTHLHGEFIDPMDESRINRTKTPQLAYTPALEFEKIKQLTESFERVFGYRPRSFRAGRFGISHQTINFLEELGYLVDSSVTPFRKIKFDEDHEVNFWGAPYHPYFPSRKNIIKIGRAGVLEVPVSTIIPIYANLPLFLQRLIGKNPRLVKRVLRKLTKLLSFRADLIYLRPLRASPKGFIENAEQIISLWQSKYPPILNIMFHSVEVMSGCSPYTLAEEDVLDLINSLNKLIKHLRNNYDLQSLILSEMYDIV